MEENNKLKKILIISLIIIIIITSIVITNIKNKKYEEIEYNEIIENSEKINYEEKIETIKIHISGEVKYNGIIELDEGARIDDAIKIAGGLTENADISEVNLAYTLLDGQKWYIPTVGVAAHSDPQINDKNVVGVAPLGDPQIITTENGEGIIQDNQNNILKININTATQTEFETLPGIGPSLAYKIVEYRNQNGKFKTIEDLKKVSGIGENKYKQIESFVKIKWILWKNVYKQKIMSYN